MNTEISITAQPKGLDAFWLKIIAIIGMTADHAGWVFDAYLPLWAKCLLYAFGGLTFPIMAFLLCEGYRYTRNVKKYMLRLLCFAVITQIPYAWALTNQLNVLFTLLLGLVAIYITQHVPHRALGWLAVFVLTVVSSLCDWGIMGVPMVMLYFYVKNKWLKLILPVVVPMLSMGPTLISMLLAGQVNNSLPSLLYLVVGCTLTIPLLAMYSGKRGKPMQYFFYAYYPAHLIVLAVLRGLIYHNWGSLF